MFHFCYNETSTRRYINCVQYNKLRDDLALSSFWRDNKTERTVINLTGMLTKEQKQCFIMLVELAN